MKEIKKIKKVLENVGFSDFEVLKGKVPTYLRVEHEGKTSAYYGGACRNQEYCVSVRCTHYNVIYHIFRSEIITKEIKPQIGEAIDIVFELCDYPVRVVIRVYNQKGSGRKIKFSEEIFLKIYEEINEVIFADGTIVCVDIVYLGDNLFLLKNLSIFD